MFSTTDLGPLRPSLHQCNALCKVFFQSINPFVRVLHQSLFAKELDQYRRGTYIFPQVFEALLFVIYALAINIMRPDTVKQVFSTSKDNLLSQYHYAAKVSLTKIQFFKTEKINGIAAVIHYVVRLLFGYSSSHLLMMCRHFSSNKTYIRTRSHSLASLFVKPRPWDYIGIRHISHSLLGFLS